MSTRTLTLTAVMTAILCIIGPLTIPIGPVPVSLVSMVLMLIAAMLGARRSALSCGLYLLLGLVGMPVFSGFTGGVGMLAGPTGGFLLGYLPLTALTGTAYARTDRRMVHIAAMAAGTLLLYALGTAWYCLQADAAPAAAIAVCVLPFIPVDACKIAAVSLSAPFFIRQLKRGGLI